MTISQILALPPRYQMAELVRYARIGSGLSVSALARAAGCCRNAIARIERGEFCPTRTLREAISDATGERVDAAAWEAAAHSWHLYARSRTTAEWRAEQRAARQRGGY